MKQAISILLICMLSGCAGQPQPPQPKTEAEELAIHHGANIVKTSNFRTGKREAYARLRDRSKQWVSSGSGQTKTVTAAQTWELDSLLADEMRAGVEDSGLSPDDGDDWLDDLFGP